MTDKPSIFVSFLNETSLPRRCAQALGTDLAEIEYRRFPDGESYLNLLSDVRGKNVVVLVDLSPPDARTLPLLMLADLLRDQGAASVGLVSAYLPYMRQDIRFHPGEALTSKTFASLVSGRFDWLVTVDPHLHRYRSLREIYTIPGYVLHAAPTLADWVQAEQPNAVLLGPDEESEQWVSQVARMAGTEYTVGRKVRQGDRKVTIHFPELQPQASQPLILVDDIISSGFTMIESVKELKRCYNNPVYCLAVHGIFAEQADQRLHAVGVETIVTTNSVNTSQQTLDLSSIIVPAIKQAITEKSVFI